MASRKVGSIVGLIEYVVHNLYLTFSNNGAVKHPKVTCSLYMNALLYHCTRLYL